MTEKKKKGHLFGRRNNKGEENLSISAPSGMVHQGHLGFDSGGNFEMRNLPPAWDSLFGGLNGTLKQMGVKGLTKAEAKLLLRMAAQSPGLNAQFQLNPAPTQSEPPLIGRTIGAPTNVRHIDHGVIPSDKILNKNRETIMKNLKPIKLDLADRLRAEGDEHLEKKRKRGSIVTAAVLSPREERKAHLSEERKQRRAERKKRRERRLRELKRENTKLKGDLEAKNKENSAVKEKMKDMVKLVAALEEEKTDLEFQLSETRMKSEGSRIVFSPEVKNEEEKVNLFIEEELGKVKEKMSKELKEWKSKHEMKEKKVNDLSAELVRAKAEIARLSKEVEKNAAARADKELTEEAKKQKESKRKRRELEKLKKHWAEETKATEPAKKTEPPPNLPEQKVVPENASPPLPPREVPPVPSLSAPPLDTAAPPPPSGGPPSLASSVSKRLPANTKKEDEDWRKSKDVPPEGRSALLQAIANPNFVLKHVEAPAAKKESAATDDSNPLAMIAKALIARRAAIDEMGGEDDSDEELWENDWND